MKSKKTLIGLLLVLLTGFNLNDLSWAMESRSRTSAPTGDNSLQVTELDQKEKVRRLLDEANELRHHFNRPIDISHAAQIYHSVLKLLRGTESNSSQMSAAYLGLAKIVNREHDTLSAIEFARNSIMEGNPNDLRTLVWLINHPALGNGERLGMFQRIMDLEERDCSPDDEPFLRLYRARALLGLANAHIADKHLYYTEALRITQSLAQSASVATLEAQALIGLGNLRIESRSNFEKALRIARTFQNLTLQAQALIGLGHAHVDQESTFREALRIAQAIPDFVLQAQAFIGLGNAKVDKQRNFEEALRIARGIKDLRLQAQALIGLGHSLIDPARNFGEALQIARVCGDALLQAQALIGLGYSRVDQEYHYNQALLIARALKNDLLEAQILIGLGRAKINDRTNFSDALRIATRIGDLTLQAQALIGLGNARLEERRNYNDALQIARYLKDATLEAQALNGLGNFEAANRRNVEAIRYYESALAVTNDPQFQNKIRLSIQRCKRYL